MIIIIIMIMQRIIFHSKRNLIKSAFTTHHLYVANFLSADSYLNRVIVHGSCLYVSLNTYLRCKNIR